MGMLVTILCWWLNDAYRFKMLVTDSLWERIFKCIKIGHQHLKSVTNIPKFSPTYFVSNINIDSETTTEGKLPNRFNREPSYPGPIWFGTTEILLKFQVENKFYRFVCFYFYLDINQLSCIETLFIFLKVKLK